MTTHDALRCAAIIPTLNEAAHIGGLLNQLLAKGGPDLATIIVADGGSTDTTRAIVQEIAEREPKVRLIANPARIQAAGINLAVRDLPLNIDVIVRVDAHALYPDDFIPRLLANLVSSGGVSVVVRLKSVGEGCLQKAIGAVSNTVFGTGGAAHRMGAASGFVDHGHHAVMRRSAFEAAGGYDETFSANEDAELDLRLAQAGGKIWFAADIIVDYFPRETLTALARQYFRYGFGRARTLRKHRMRLRLRQMVPPAVLVVLVGASVVALVQPFALLIPLGYFAACALVGISLAIGRRDACLLLGGPALPAMHLPWALGFWISLVMPRRARRAS